MWCSINLHFQVFEAVGFTILSLFFIYIFFLNVMYIMMCIFKIKILFIYYILLFIKNIIWVMLHILLFY